MFLKKMCLKKIFTLFLFLNFFPIASAAGVSVAGNKLQHIAEFPENLTGSPSEINPGNLKMFLYVPDGVKKNAPVVFVLHGCLQSAEKINRQTGWSKLADINKFYLVFPQQQGLRASQEIKTGNPGLCFDWSGYFGKPKARGEGEDKSILDMLEYLDKSSLYSIDRKRVFITGLSAGGCMATLMLAQWPEYFAGGAPIAGVPFGCAKNKYNGFKCMGVKPSFFPRRGKKGECVESGEACMDASFKKEPQQWAEEIRRVYGLKQPQKFPKIMIWHGSRDQYVDDDNLQETVEQWTAIHGVDMKADNNGSKLKDGHERHEYKEYKDKDGNVVVASVLVEGLRHGVSIEPGDANDQGGEEVTNSLKGGYSFDYMLHSSYYIARFWGIAK